MKLQDFIGRNPARKLAIPESRKPKKIVLSEQEIAHIMRHLGGRDRLIIHMFLVLGLRPGEVFALRRNDRVEPSQIRIDESVSEELRGPERVVLPKTIASAAYVWLPKSVKTTFNSWLKQMQDQRPEAFVFASKHGTPLNMNNFLRRVIKPAAARARVALLDRGVPLPVGFLVRVNHQVFRRTCGTLMQKHGSVKDIQAHLRHSTPATTMREYVQEIPASVREAVESLDIKLSKVQRRKLSRGVLNTFEHEFKKEAS